MPRQAWLVTAFAEFNFGDAAMVRADTEEEAALLGAEILSDENACGDEEEVEQVFVVPFDNRKAYVTKLAVEPAPLDCCGGNAPEYVSSSPHWATCPMRPEGTGQERTDDEREEVVA
jgi:hypothetical protein